MHATPLVATLIVTIIMPMMSAPAVEQPSTATASAAAERPATGSPVANTATGAPAEETWRTTMNDRLDHLVSFDFTDTDLTTVAAILQHRTGIIIVLDPQVAAAAPPPVTLTIKTMKLHDALDAILKLSGLHYVVLDGGVFISNTDGKKNPVAGMTATAVASAVAAAP